MWAISYRIYCTMLANETEWLSPIMIPFFEHNNWSPYWVITLFRPIFSDKNVIVQNNVCITNIINWFSQVCEQKQFCCLYVTLYLLYNTFESRHTIYSYFDFGLKISSFRLPYQRPSSSDDCTRELFKGSNGSASLVDCTWKKFLVGGADFLWLTSISEVVLGSFWLMLLDLGPNR